MKESTNREKVLKKVRSALLSKTANPFPNIDFDSSVFQVNDLPQEVNFADALSSLGGNFILCENTVEVIEMLLAVCNQHQWKKIFCDDKNLSDLLTEFEFPFINTTRLNDTDTIDAAIISCAGIISRTGQIVFSNAEITNPKTITEAENLVLITNVNQIKTDLKEVISILKENNNKKLSPFIVQINPKSFNGGIFVLMNQQENEVQV